MTANLVNGLGSQMNLIPQPSAGNGHSSGTDFSEVLSSSSAKENEKASAGNDNRSDKLNQTTKPEKTEKSEKKQDVSEDKVEKKNKSDETSKDKAVKDSVKTEDKDGIPAEEVMEQVAEAVAVMIQTVAEVLEVPVEEVTEAIDALGLTDMEVLYSKNVPALAVEITGSDDVAAIMTDEELFADVKGMMETSDNLMNELAKDLNVPVEDIKEQISEQVARIKNSEDTDEQVQTTEADTSDVISVDVAESKATVNVKQEGGRNNSSADEQNNHSATAVQSMVDTIKATVDEIVTEMPVSYTNVSMEDILEQVTESLKTTMKEDITEMEMQLHPASLGNVKVQVAARDGVITANFTTQNEEVKQALETQIVQLKEQMSEQGIKVEAVEVTVNSQAFDRSFNDEHDQSNGQNESEAKKKRVRGINLSGLDLNNLDELDEEDRVTADMMAKQGNTVDYLA